MEMNKALTRADLATAYTYADLLNADRTINAVVFDAICNANIAAEVNLALCVAGGRFIPKSVCYAHVREWRAFTAADIDRDAITAREREAIAADCRAELLAIAAARGGRQ
jgi:hypothetical protein